MNNDEIKQIMFMIIVAVALIMFFVSVLWLVLKINYPYREETLFTTLKNAKGVWHGKFN